MSSVSSFGVGKGSFGEVFFFQKVRRCFTPPSVRNFRSAFFLGGGGGLVQWLSPLFSWTFSRFSVVFSHFQSLSIIFSHFQTLSVTLSRSKTQELIDNRKVGKTTLDKGRGLQDSKDQILESCLDPPSCRYEFRAFLPCMIRSEKLLNESFPNFSNFRPEFCPEFCSEFCPNFSRTFRASFRGRWRPEKFTKNPRHFSMQNSQANTKKLFTKVFWRARKVMYDRVLPEDYTPARKDYIHKFLFLELPFPEKLHFT